MKILTVIGARPQFIKAAVLSRVLRLREPVVSEIIVHTGQHYDANMSDVFFEELAIPCPDFHLGIGGGTHGENTGRMIEGLEKLMLDQRPDWVLVYGDTDSTLAGALAASKLHIPIAHVEAGLRSFNRRMPEEINRVVTDHLSELLLVPSASGMQNLAREGIGEDKSHLVGDVMYDAALYYGRLAERRSRILIEHGLKSGTYGLVTLHRQENVDDCQRLKAILLGFERSARLLLWPMHPRTAKRIADFGITLPNNVIAIAPIGYLDMVMLEKHAAVIATDSGGVQKEAFFHHTPCITLRDETEWVELVEAGANQLVGANADAITDALSNVEAFPAGAATGLYGSGDAGDLIARVLSAS